MIVIAALFIGASFGAVIARRRKGNRLDMLQYAAVNAIIFGILGMFLTLIIEKML